MVARLTQNASVQVVLVLPVDLERYALPSNRSERVTGSAGVESAAALPAGNIRLAPIRLAYVQLAAHFEQVCSVPSKYKNVLCVGSCGQRGSRSSSPLKHCIPRCGATACAVLNKSY